MERGAGVPVAAFRFRAIDRSAPIEGDPPARRPGRLHFEHARLRGRRLLRQAVVNLIENAISHGGPRITLRLRPGPVIEVEDDGLGFDPGAARCDGSGGFGLFNLRERLSALQGEVQIDSAPGEGTTVRFGLPAA